MKTIKKKSWLNNKFFKYLTKNTKKKYCIYTEDFVIKIKLFHDMQL